ncbi:lipoyl(octanoyl) transferase LipB [Gilvimarinus xylanilyticus]|uniref:Octanoyltransferase n=1 Tax=Gilvimarinus xylanilyticus TaxID=2944139 RepID=A0A9X2KU27_9GAMM|nr:lipoyl(octanoyl) transferase LipB [Gilvimarinus xylanilyticus]MCP8899398.1 lipoyl(octanoyl) transferase LipB [Gilvimarinus xylanilyticus]
MSESTIIVRQLGVRDYQSVWRAMSDFTDHRDTDTPDELWLVEHPPVFTQGQAGKPEHLLAVEGIPLVQTDRGGQVTYHGPGQLVAYPLLNLRRYKLGVRDLVTLLESTLVTLLADYGIDAYAKPDAPGVYIDGAKIASLGLRVRRGCSFHGLALNVNMDLTPFAQINPCGYAGLAMVDMARLLPKAPAIADVGDGLVAHLVQKVGAKTGIIPAAEYSRGEIHP